MHCILYIGDSPGRITVQGARSKVQVKSTGHCPIDKLPNHTDSPPSNRAFC